ncbi:bifunctional DNA primase/polymerase [Alcaligenaceae bacterium]|nr:bifunctional DNA primase/polymerase [Alcaligenaceae bacterium]
MASVSPIRRNNLKAAIAYAKLGWKVFPAWWVAESGKCACGDSECKNPGKHPLQRIAHRGQQDATTDTATIKKWWDAYPDANIAIPMAPSGLVAIDIDPRNGGWDTIDDIENKHGPLQSDVLALTGGGGEHRVFTLPEGLAGTLPGKLGPGVDVKVNGYIIAEPSNHVSGRTYEWEASSNPLEGIVPSPLPDWLRGLFQAGQTSQHASHRPNNLAIALSEADSAELQSALAVIDSSERDTWLKAGMALHSTHAGQQAFAIWDTWSQTCQEKYDYVDQLRTWRSFRNKGLDGVTKSTIFKLAQDAGWINPAAGQIAKTASPEQIDELRALVKKSEAIATVKEAPERLNTPFPVHSLDMVSQWVATVAGISPGVHTQMAAISVASLAASRLYESQIKDGCHLHQMITAQSFGEVSPILNAIVQVFADAGMRKLIRGQRISSLQSFYRTLHRSPATLYIAPDWGSAVAYSRRQSSGVLEQILGLIAQSFDQPFMLLDNPEELGLKASHGVEGDMPVIYQPCMSVFGFISESMLSHTFSASEIGRGGVEKMLFTRQPVQFQGDPQPSETPDWLIKHLTDIRRLTATGAEHDLSTIFNGNAGLVPTAYTVKFQARPEEHYPRFDQLSTSRMARPVVHAARVNLRRLACVLAVWENPQEPVATRAIMDWSADFVAGALNESLLALRLLGGSEDGKVSEQQKVLAAIVEAGSEGVSEAQLARYCWAYKRLPREKRNDLIDTLIQDEDIFAVKGKNGKGARFVAARFIEQGETNE